MGTTDAITTKQDKSRVEATSLLLISAMLENYFGVKTSISDSLRKPAETRGERAPFFASVGFSINACNPAS
jgi:hypothetical protein